MTQSGTHNKPFSHSPPCCSNPRLKYENEATNVKTFLARFSVECKQKRQTKISSYLWVGGYFCYLSLLIMSKYLQTLTGDAHERYLDKIAIIGGEDPYLIPDWCCVRRNLKVTKVRRHRHIIDSFLMGSKQKVQVFSCQCRKGYFEAKL